MQKKWCRQDISVPSTGWFTVQLNIMDLHIHFNNNIKQQL